MKIKIADQCIELIEPAPAVEDLPPGQAEAYRLLRSLEGGSYSESLFIRLLGLKSVLPFRARLNHLVERGVIRLAI